MPDDPKPPDPEAGGADADDGGKNKTKPVRDTQSVTSTLNTASSIGPSLNISHLLSSGNIHTQEEVRRIAEKKARRRSIYTTEEYHQSYSYEKIDQQGGLELLPGQLYMEKNRPVWKSKYNAFFSMVGFMVGISNIYRFPYLCSKFGGLTFMIPYFVFLVLTGLPIAYLESILGQFTQSGMIMIWIKLVPILRGVGWTQAFLTLIFMFYNNAFLAWAMHYCLQSLFTMELPWIGCEHDWNTDGCRDMPPDFEEVKLADTELRPGAEYFRGRIQRRWTSKYAGDDVNVTAEGNGKKTYGLSPKDEKDMGAPHWEFFLTLGFVYFLLYILLKKGLRFKGKAIWFLVITPYVITFLLIFRGIAVPGALNGLKLWLSFRGTDKGVSRFFYAWPAAASQVLLSLGAGTGGLMTLASYRPFTANAYRITIITVVVDTVASLMLCCVIFIAIGNIMASDGADGVDELFAQGPDLLFEVCSDFWGRLPGSDFLCFILYLVICLLAFVSVSHYMICAKEAIFEACGEWFDRNGKTRWVFFNSLMIFSYLVGLLCLTRAGMHIFLIFEKFAIAISCFTCSLFMIIGSCWFWGLHELCDAAEAMTGRRPSCYLQISWKFITPIVLLMVLFSETFFGDNDLVYNEKHKDVHLSKGYRAVGHFLAHFPNILIIIGIIVHFVVSEGKGCKQKLLLGISPNYAHESILEMGTNCRTEKTHYCYCVDVPQIIRRMTRRFSRVAPETFEKGRRSSEVAKEIEAGNNKGPTTTTTDKPETEVTAPASQKRRSSVGSKTVS